MKEMAKKIRVIEKSVLDFILKHNFVFFLGFFTLLALIIRYKLIGFASGDFVLFLKPWFEELQAGGGFQALAHYPGDYNAPYMTILALLTYLPFSPLVSIKLFSIAFDIFLALSVAWLVHILSAGKKNRKFLTALAYIVTLLIPSVILNSGYWGQCDAVYGTFAVLALCWLFKKRYTYAFICLGIAFAFKLQIIFILPIFVVLYIKEQKFSIFHFLIIPLVNFALCLPAIFAGKPLTELLTVYFNQTQTYSNALTSNLINIYSIFEADPTYWNLAGILITLGVCALALFWIIQRKVKFDTHEKIFVTTLWFIIIITFLMPGMHERYLFVGEVLAVAYYLIYRKNGAMVLTINLYALVTYASYLNGNILLNYQALALIECCVIAWFTKNVCRTLVNETAS